MSVLEQLNRAQLEFVDLDCQAALWLQHQEMDSQVEDVAYGSSDEEVHQPPDDKKTSSAEKSNTCITIPDGTCIPQPPPVPESSSDHKDVDHNPDQQCGQQIDPKDDTHQDTTNQQWWVPDKQASRNYDQQTGHQLYTSYLHSYHKHLFG